MLLHLCYDKKGTYKDVLSVKDTMIDDTNHIIIKVRMSTLPLDVLYDNNLRIELTYEEFLLGIIRRKEFRRSGIKCTGCILILSWSAMSSTKN